MDDRGYFELRDFYIALKGSCKVSLEEGAGPAGEGEGVGFLCFLIAFHFFA